MNVTHCNCGGDSRVVDSRETAGAVRRRRRCLECGSRWTTRETRNRAETLDEMRREVCLQVRVLDGAAKDLLKRIEELFQE